MLTGGLIDEPGEPTRDALDQVLALFRSKLLGEEPTDRPVNESVTRPVVVIFDGVVAGEHVVAEVVERIAPHGVGVVGVALGVVVLDDEARALDAVVVRIAR